MNKIFLIGRITKKPELFATTSGSYICDFNIAINRPGAKDEDGEKITDFIRCKVWNKLAENLVKFQDKGNLIALNGRLQVDYYTDKDGKNRTSTYVLVEELEYLERKKTTDDAPVENEPVEKNPFEEFGDSIKTESSIGEQITIDDDELPF